jgi:uncharacterized protein (DUF849 family)
MNTVRRSNRVHFSKIDERGGAVVTRIKACLNGQRGPDEHPGVPITAAEVGGAATAAVAAGAEAVHVHPRDAGGGESLRAADVGAVVEAVRRDCPGTPVGVSTGLWIAGGDPGARLALVSGWADLPTAVRPDFASVNLSEPGFAELAAALRDTGIAVEAGVWSPTDAERVPAAGELLRILVEVLDAPAEDAIPAADRILDRLDRVGATGPRLLHGEGTACWPLISYAGRRGLPTRIGLEDTLTGPAGEPVADNAELVRLAIAAWSGLHHA